MEISAAGPSSSSNLEGILGRGKLPFDTARTEPPPNTTRPTDSFRPSLRTPLDADRILAREARALEPAPLLGSGRTMNGASDSTTTESDPGAHAKEAGRTDETEAQGKSGGEDGKKDEADLSEEEKAQVAELERRDREVRTHEQAHLAAAGGMARGGASFDYQTGPDGKRYAVGGEVQIAMKSGKTPEETIRNAEQVRAAAMAPADPSSVDQQTAAAAGRMAQEARQELSAKESDGTSDGSDQEGKLGEKADRSSGSVAGSSDRDDPGAGNSNADGVRSGLSGSEPTDRPERASTVSGEPRGLIEPGVDPVNPPGMQARQTLA